MIPKTIHYCWFGGRPKPPIVQRCIDSWLRVMPDYTIQEWNETNFHVNNPQANQYVRDAYQSRKYAFVTDYARFWIMFHCGGIYMDSDVEVYKPFDCFLQHSAFTGHETDRILITAVMGMEAGHDYAKMMMDYYETAQFDPNHMIPNTRIITDMTWPLIVSKNKGIRGVMQGMRQLENGMVIYPVETFCSFDHKNLKPIPTPNSYACHLFAGTWLGRTPV